MLTAINTIVRQVKDWAFADKAQSHIVYPDQVAIDIPQEKIDQLILEENIVKLLNKNGLLAAKLEGHDINGIDLIFELKRNSNRKW